MIDIKTLKIFPIVPEISKSVKENQVTIVTTPTSSGKTLLVPLIAAEITGEKVYVTTPKVFLTKSAAKNLAELVLGNYDRVGVWTGKARHNTDAQIVFFTERSFLNNIKLTKKDVLVIDEVHEQGIDLEEVLYVAKNHVENGGKVVIMSATMSTNKIVSYFGMGEVFTLPESERSFPCEYVRVNSIDEAVKLASQSNISLVGVAGKGDMEKIASNLNEYPYPIYFFHGEMEEWDEEEMMDRIEQGLPCMILATSVAMSGLTLPSLDAVVVPRYGKRIENGELKEYTLSKAEAKQWAGRGGRVSSGVIISYTDDSMREDEPTPEILRGDIAEIFFSFWSNRIDLRKIQLMNQPSAGKLDSAYTLLIESGIITGEGLTEKGKFIREHSQGILEGSLLYEGLRTGIPAFALKLASLIREGNPFRKMRYNFKNCDISKKSQHFLVIKTIEEDNMLDYKFNMNLKEYAERFGIYMKGVKNLRKNFERIDREWIDEKEVSLKSIQDLLSNQPKNFLYDNSYNKYIGRAQEGLYGDKTFSNPTPVILKRGRLMELTTVIE